MSLKEEVFAEPKSLRDEVGLAQPEPASLTDTLADINPLHETGQAMGLAISDQIEESGGVLPAMGAGVQRLGSSLKEFMQAERPEASMRVDPVSGQPRYAVEEDGEKIGNVNLLAQEIGKTPTVAQNAVGGALQVLGAEDLIETNNIDRAMQTLQNPETPPMDKVMAGVFLVSPVAGYKYILDKADEVRAGLLESIAFSDKSNGKESFQWGDKTITGEYPEITLREVLKQAGVDISESAQEKLDLNTPEQPNLGQEAIMATGRSVGLLAGGSGVLKAADLLSAGSISTLFGVDTFLDVYSETVERTGSEQKGFSNGLFQGIVEKVTENPAFKMLEKVQGDTFLKALGKFYAVELPGELIAETLQYASDLLHSDVGEKMTYLEVFENVQDAFPHIAAVTTLATSMSGGITVGGFKSLNAAVTKYEIFKKNQLLTQAIDATDKVAKYKNDIAEMTHYMAELSNEVVESSLTLQEAEARIVEIGNSYKAFTGDGYFGQLIALNTLGPHRQYDPTLTLAMEATKVATDQGLEDFHVVDVGEPGVFFASTFELDNVLADAKEKVNLAKFELAQKKQQLANGQILTIAKWEEDVTKAENFLYAKQKEKVLMDFTQKSLVPFLQKLAKVYAPDMTIILSDKSQRNNPDSIEESTTQGAHYRTTNNSVILEVNPRGLYDKVSLNADGSLEKLDSLPLMEVAAHEFGHALAFDYFTKLPEAVQKAMYQAYDQYRQNAYEMYLDPAATATELHKLGRGAAITQEKLKSIRRPSTFDNKKTFHFGKITAKHSVDSDVNAKGFDNADSTLTAQDPFYAKGSFFNYVMAFDEWFAHEMERTVLGQSNVNKIAKSVFLKEAAILKRFHDRAKSTYRPSQAFDALLEYFQVSVQEQMQADNEYTMSNITANKAVPTEMANAQDMVSEAITNIADGLGVDILNQIADPKASMDKFNGFMKNVLTLTQIVRENPHISELQKYMEYVERWWAEKSKWNERAVESVGAWQSLGKEQADRLARFSLAVTLRSDELGRRLTNAELEELNAMRVHQLNDDAMSVWEQLDQDFQDALGYDNSNPQALYKALLADIKRVHAANPEAAMEAITILNKEMVQMANRNFFPLSRFGRYKVLVKAKRDIVHEGVQYQEGDVVIFETYEDIPTQKKKAEELATAFPRSNFDVLPGILDDTQFAYAGLPPNLIKALRGQLGLSAEQQESLDAILLEQTTAARFKKHLLQRAGVPGYSHDAMRGYAAYMAHFANAVARMEFAPLMTEQITGIENSVGIIQRQAGKDMGQITEETNKRQEMIGYLKEHFEYVMNPGDELANLRSVAFLVYMGLLPKSAYVNLTQVPLVAWPYLSSRKELGGSGTSTGTVASIAIMGAMKDVGNIFKGKEGKFKPDELEMFDELVRRGILDESLAQELGALAEGSNLQRMLPDKWGFGKLKSRTASKVIRNASYAGAYLFHNAEKFNRRITALAAYRLSRKQGATIEVATREAHKAVTETQYEYARWNRPKLMRGKKSVIFMFKMYLENTLYHIARGEGGKRSILLFAMLGGLSGLPGAEDAADFYDLLVNLYNKHFGKQGARSAIREDARELANALNLDPNMVLHGLGHKYGLGPVHLLEWAGVPVPNVNIAGSISLGRVVPGLEAILEMDNPNANAQLGKATADAAGAVVAIPVSWYKALTSDNPDTWKRLEQGMPNAIRYWSQASRFIARGKETRMDGSTLYDFDLSDPLDIGKILAHGAGFQGTHMSEMKERDWAIKEAAQFFRTRKSILLSQFAMATFTKDREGKADAKKAIKNYNSTVPHSSLKISGKDTGRALRMKRQNQVMAERGLGKGRRGVPQAKALNELYPIHEEATK